MINNTLCATAAMHLSQYRAANYSQLPKRLVGPCRTASAALSRVIPSRNADPRSQISTCRLFQPRIGKYAISTKSQATEGAGETNQPTNIQFDWRLAVALGGCSFEAYNDPENSDGLGERTPSGSRIIYADKEFLLEKMSGLLHVTVKSGSNLPAADLWPGTSDPYCILQIGESSCTTSVVKNNLNPVWDETFSLYVRDSAKQRLVARVLDEDIGKNDDFLGSSVRGLSDLCKDDGQEHRLTLELKGPKGPAGQLHLMTTFQRFNSVLAEEASTGRMGGPVNGTPGRPLLSRMPSTHLDTGKESPWKELQRLAGIAATSMFKPLCFIENIETDAQAWILWNNEEGIACVAFRGTEQAKWKDLLTDVSLVPATLDPERVADSPSNAGAIPVCLNTCMLGFMRNYRV